MRRDWLQILLVSAAWGHLWTAVAVGDSLSFERDIQPILAEHCFACHGPDANHRQADLRLDTSDGLRVVVTPGDSQGSTLFQRVATNDPVLRMPPAESHASLSGDQLSLLRRWIDEGAAWDEHWAFVPATRPAVPTDLPPIGGYGGTDELGFNAVEHPVHVHDFQATLLHLLGIDHERLTYRFQGRQFRLTDVHGKVVTDLLA